MNGLIQLFTAPLTYISLAAGIIPAIILTIVLPKTCEEKK